MGKNNKIDDIEMNDAKDKKEIKKSNWYLKLQKPIRIIYIIITTYFMLFIPSVKGKDRILDFNITEPMGINMIHGRIFSTHVGEVVTTISDGVMVALGAALASFVLAWIWEMFDNDTWYKYQNIGLCICGLVGVYFPVVNLLIGGGKLTSNGYVVATYAIIVIIAIVIAVFNIIKFKGKKDVYASEKKLLKIGPMVLILLASIGAFIYPVISLADEYIEVNEIRQLVENHPEEYREDVEDQMGNYAMGIAFSYEEEIYILDKIKNENGGYGVFKIDENGNYDLIWSVDGTGIMDRLVVHDGYMYVCINDGSNNEKKASIVRCAIGDTNQEVVVSFNGMVDFGISDNQLMYYEILDNSGNLDDYESVYTVDLEKPFDDTNKVLYDKGILYNHFDRDSWMNIVLYNKHDDYYRYYGKYSQSYENSSYYITDERQLVKCVYSAEADGKLDDSDEYYHAIDSNVYAYNIYEGRIYYVKAANDREGHVIYSDNEVWSCGLSGENKKMIGAITAKSDEGNGEYYVCSGIYVTDDYVVCDFDRSGDYASERYMMRKSGGFYSKIY
ncbi:MAG: hypothetical protein IJX85_11565 [Lachnospiraceae bacterium]|nr:hypothetical protein [Lachnospiraceae bacterium]